MHCTQPCLFKSYCLRSRFHEPKKFASSISGIPYTDSFTDSETEITKVVPAMGPNNNNSTEINIKQEDVSEIRIIKDIPVNEQKNSPTEIDIKEDNILENWTSDTRTLRQAKPDVNRGANG